MAEKKKATIDDVAREARVAKGTVSRVIGNRPHVAPSTRKLVLDAMRKVGYRPNYFAQNALAKRSRTLVLAISEYVENLLSYDHLFNSIVYELNRVCHDYKYMLSLAVLKKGPGGCASLPGYLKERFIEGIFILGHMEPACIDAVRGFSKNIVSIEAPGIVHELSSVTPDYFRVGHISAGHLVNLGHKRIAITTVTETQMASVAERIRGVEVCMSQAGLGIPAEYRLVYDAHLPASFPGRDIVERVLSMKIRPTGIIFMGDNIAIAAIHHFQARNIDVPGDISIVGYGNHDVASHCIPRLTTVEVNTQHICYESFNLLKEMIDKPDYHRTRGIRRISLSVDLIERDSTATPPAERTEKG